MDCYANKYKFLYTQVGGEDEGTEFGLAAADASGTGMKVVADILPVARHTVGRVSLEIVPDLLGGVEFRGIAGEPLDMQGVGSLAASGPGGDLCGCAPGPTEG